MLEIPVQDPICSVEVHCVKQSDNKEEAGPLWHLHQVASPNAQKFAKVNPELYQRRANVYQSKLDTYVENLTELVENREFDVITKAPSSREDAQPYFDSIKAEFPDALDLSDCFSKKDGCKAGSAASLKKFLPCLTFGCDCELGDYSRLLIVDDLMSNGLTAAAMIRRLQEEGLQDEAEISVAVPLLLREK